MYFSLFCNFMRGTKHRSSYRKVISDKNQIGRQAARNWTFICLVWQAETTSGRDRDVLKEWLEGRGGGESWGTRSCLVGDGGGGNSGSRR